MNEVINVDTISWAYNELIRLEVNPKHPFIQRMERYILCPDILLKEISCLEKDLVRTRVENILLDEKLKEVEDELNLFKNNEKAGYFPLALEKERNMNDC